MLSALEVDVVALNEMFPENIDDEAFIRQLSSGYVFVTHDRHQRTRRAQAMAIKEVGFTALWLGRFWGRMDFWQQARWLTYHWQTVDKFASGAVVGTCAEIQQNGRAMPFAL